MSNETTPSQTTDSASQQVGVITESLVNLGAIWAQHGVSVGRLALKTQSAWLRGLSSLLNQVADAMEPLTRSNNNSPHDESSTSTAA